MSSIPALYLGTKYLTPPAGKETGLLRFMVSEVSFHTTQSYCFELRGKNMGWRSPLILWHAGKQEKEEGQEGMVVMRFNPPRMAQTEK